MYKKPSVLIIRKEDIQQIKAMACSGSGGCFASGACHSEVDKAGSCTSKSNDVGGTRP